MPNFGPFKQPHSPFDDRPNELPLDAPATMFQYRYYLDWEFFVDFLVAGEISLAVGALSGGIPFVGQTIAQRDVSGEWKIQIRDGQIVIFEQEVAVTVTLTVMAFSVFGTLNVGFFTWAFKNEVIKTTIVDGNEITLQNPAWSHTLGGTEFSEFGIMESGSSYDPPEYYDENGHLLEKPRPVENDFTDSSGFVSDWWDSPVYKMQVPVGATHNVVFSRAQGGHVARNLLFEYRFIEEPNIAAFLDRVGAIRAALPIRNHVFAGHTYYGPRQRTRRDDIGTASNPATWKDSTNRQFWIAKRGAAYYLWYSDNEGMEIRPVVYSYEDVHESNPAAVEGNQVALWSDRYTNVDGAPRKQGGYVTSAALGDKLYAAFAPDGRNLTNIREVGPHDGRPCKLMVGSTADGRARYVLTDNVDLQYESTDGLNYVKIED